MDENILCHGGIIFCKALSESFKLLEHLLPKIDARKCLGYRAALRPHAFYKLSAAFAVEHGADLQPRESRQGVVAAVGYRLFPNEGADILFKACKATAVAEALFKRLAGPFGKGIVFRGSEAHYNAAFGL